jgi:hypothetical protein
MFTRETSMSETTCNGVQPECSHATPAAGSKPARKPAGPPRGNVNRLTHGLRSVRISNGKYPKEFSYIGKLAGQLRNQLEAAVVVLRGEVSLYSAGLINTAVRWECHARLCQRYLRNGKDSPLAVKVDLSRDIARSSERRDACFKLLGLDRAAGSSDPWAAIRDATPQLPADEAGDESDPEAAEGPADEPTGQPEADSAADVSATADEQGGR